MGEVSTIGLDIAKAVFQVHGVDGAGTVVIRKRISRAKMLEFFSDLPPCLVGIEACPSAHHWGRELTGLGQTSRRSQPSATRGCGASAAWWSLMAFTNGRRSPSKKSSPMRSR